MKLVNIPYQMDVTALTSVTNLVIDGIIELAKEQMIDLPPDIKPYVAVDIATYGVVLQNLARWQVYLVNNLNISDDLKPLSYTAVDYNNIISLLNYYGRSLNKIIEACNDMRQ